MATLFGYGPGVGHTKSMFHTASGLKGMYYQLAQFASKSTITGDSYDEMYAAMTPKLGLVRGHVDFVEGKNKKREFFNNLFQLKTILKENPEESIQMVYLYDNLGFFNRQKFSTKR